MCQPCVCNTWVLNKWESWKWQEKKNDVRSKDLFSTLYVQSPALDSRKIGVQTGAHEADSDGSKQSKEINKHYSMLDDRKQETTIGREAE